MKNIVVVFLIFLGSYFTHAQDKDLKKILSTSTWRIDIESMKPQILLKFATVPEMKELSKEEREIAVKNVLVSLSKLKYKFGEDGSFKNFITGEIEYVGSYTLNVQDNELITNLEIEPNSVFKIVSFDHKKIVLHHKLRNNDLILIPEN